MNKLKDIKESNLVIIMVVLALVFIFTASLALTQDRDTVEYKMTYKESLEISEDFVEEYKLLQANEDYLSEYGLNSEMFVNATPNIIDNEKEYVFQNLENSDEFITVRISLVNNQVFITMEERN